ncbi:DUF6768 family protein [Pseudidiomarina sp.]|uniref:DUF6768 family protein n=1 Tax=Pseudidiomarina sp. TaxID=2081707 RepID=UPI00299CE22D|nr:DUF6768 family protein [Pseudidiomarina sp.]MDX1705358.1 DUF6768 family protein [Pseudidiomarina sp.]
MSIDDKIKQDLSEQAHERDRMMAENRGLFAHLAAGFRLGMRWVMVIGYLLAILLTAAMIYTGYHFLTTAADERVLWGVLFLTALIMQVTTKLWIWTESNRKSLLLELKRMELRLLSQQRSS